MTQAVVLRLRDEIRTGALAPGTRLRQVELAQRLGVSTTPVREALAALHREGLVSSDAHKGVVVFRPTSEDLHETYEMRMALEVLATEKAVPNLTRKDLGALREFLDEMATLEPGDADRYPGLNGAFHARIYAAAGRPRLAALIGDLRDASMAYLTFLGADHVMANEGRREHEDIYDACVARAPRRAAKAMAHHLQTRLADFVAEMEALEPTA